MPKSPWLRFSSPRISAENSEMKNVCPGEEKNASNTPNNRNRHCDVMKRILLCKLNADMKNPVIGQNQLKIRLCRKIRMIFYQSA
jgi:hypothetical protein